MDIILVAIIAMTMLAAHAVGLYTDSHYVHAMPARTQTPIRTWEPQCSATPDVQTLRWEHMRIAARIARMHREWAEVEAARAYDDLTLHVMREEMRMDITLANVHMRNVEWELTLRGHAPLVLA